MADFTGTWDSSEQYDTMGFSGYSNFINTTKSAKISITQIQIPNSANVAVANPSSSFTYVGIASS